MTRPADDQTMVDLTRAIVRAAAAGNRPRCGDPVTHDLWLSEDRAEREQAAHWCTGCPVLTECHTAATAGDERFGVWAGIDRTITGTSKRRDTP